MKKQLLLFLNKYLELVLLLLTLAFVFTKSAYPRYGERISLIFFGTLSFYYLASGVLVFLDKKRIGRTLRLIYVLGLWGISMAVLGIMARIHLIQLNTALLYIAISAMLGAGGLALMALKQIAEPEKRTAFTGMLKPVLLRSLPALFACLLVVGTSVRTLYTYTGTYRHDPAYIETAINVYENPGDTAAQRQLEAATEALRRSGKPE